MATKTKWANVKIPLILAKQADSVLDVGGYSSRSALAQEAIRLRVEELIERAEKKERNQSQITPEDKILLEVIAQDHWNQYHSFEEEEVEESIVIEFKQDPEKPKNQNWLKSAIEYVCSLKRN